MPETITSLIEKLEGAEGPSLVLDGEIWCAVNGYTFVMWDGAGCVYRRASDGGISHEQASSIRPFSASLDAALSLAERIMSEDEVLFWLNQVVHRADQDTVNGTVKCLPLKLCAAVLRAQSEAR